MTQAEMNLAIESANRISQRFEAENVALRAEVGAAKRAFHDATVERDTLRNALRFLLDSIRWEDELRAWVVTANGAIGVAKDALEEGKS